MEKLVVTRHRDLVQYLIEKGLIDKHTKVISHAKESDVVGKHVIGVLPLWLSCHAGKITEIQITSSDIKLHPPGQYDPASPCFERWHNPQYRKKKAAEVHRAPPAIEKLFRR